MDSEKLKQIWKENAVKQIDSYTDSEIRSIVLKSARKAINHSYPGVIFWSVLILSSLACIGLMLRFASPQLHTYGYVLSAAILLLLSGAVCLSEWGRRKGGSYSFDMPMTEWLQSRIRYFDKGIRRSKNWLWRFGCGVAVLLFFCLIYVFTAGFSLKVLMIQLVSGLTALVIAGYIANGLSLKRMSETRKQLQDLYDQLRD